MIRSRCKQVASAPKQYGSPIRVTSCEQYFSLLDLFGRLDPERDYDLLAGALAVYGWMPRMMNKLTSRDQLKKLIDDLRRSSDRDVAVVLRRHRDTGALRAVNNSTWHVEAVALLPSRQDRHLGFSTWSIL